MAEPIIITTEDGSHSLLNRELNETYHSRHGAMQESRHVFIANGLDYLSGILTGQPIRILEVGFGTGLNTWLTWQWANEHQRSVELFTIESLPLPEHIWKQLNYAGADDQIMFDQLHRAEWNTRVELGPHFTLTKRGAPLQSVRLETGRFDLVYYDAFAPSKQPDMWEPAILEKVVNAMDSSGVFVTYCAKGQLKRDLRAFGLTVETLPGPPGKKEMIRAVRP